MNMKYRLMSLILLSIPLFTQAQNGTTSAVDMADNMRSNGKIFVVIAVVLTILIGLLAYVYRLDRRIDRLEKKSR
jgi:hypothetical protein